MFTVTINNGFYTCTPAYGYKDTILLCANKEYTFTEAPVPDLSNIPNITKDTRISLSGTFAGNRRLRYIDFTKWTHKNIVSLSGTFKGCLDLISIKGFNTLNLTACNDYQHMCEECEELREINLSTPQIKPWSWDMHLDDAFAKCNNLNTAIVSDKTPRFSFPTHTTIVDLSAGVFRVFTERITILEKASAEKDQALATLRMELDVVRRQLAALMDKLP